MPIMSRMNRWRVFLPLLLFLGGYTGVLVWLSGRPFIVGRAQVDPSEVRAVTLFVGLGILVAAGWVHLLGILFLRLCGWKGAQRATEVRPLKEILLISCGLFLVASDYAFFIEPRWIAVRRAHVEVPGLRVPVRLVHFSDTHSCGYGDNERRLAEIVNPFDPDLVVFTGDSLGCEEGLDGFRRALRDVRAKHGKFAVNGNWDVWYWDPAEPFRDTGFVVLDGHESREVPIGGQTITLVGTSYEDIPRKERVPSFPESATTIFLYHTPDLAEDAARKGAAIYLTGHTHGGQIALPGYGALVTLTRSGKKFERGLYRVGRMWLYVNPGLGVERNLPARFSVRPEITVIEMTPGRRQE
jgi:predicted MPP superfamily phosphohydrolase